MRLGARLVAIAVLLVAIFVLPGCLSATERDVILYDPATDEFQTLMVLSDIHAKDSDDLDFLAKIVANRDHWIGPTLLSNGLATGEFLRLSNSTFAPLDFFNSPASTLTIQKTAVPLGSIKITPGTLFIENQTLCYYQAIRIPGKTIDRALEEAGQAAQEEYQDSFTKGIQDELDRRATGGKTLSWDDLTRVGLQVLDDSLKSPATAPASQPQSGAAAPAPTTVPAATVPSEPPQNPTSVLSVASLNRLKAAFNAKQLHITRNRQILSLTLPLDAADAAAALKSVGAIVARTREILRGHETEKGDAYDSFRQLLAFNSCTTLTAAPEGLVISLDLLSYSRSITSNHASRTDENSTSGTQPGQPPQPPAPQPDPIAYVREHHLPVDEHLTAAKIIADFQAGMLAAHPADPPVAPGTGFSISETQPATATAP